MVLVALQEYRMNRIKSLISNNKLLLANFSYLTIVKFVTMFLPLFSYPYLIKTIGTDKYGLLIYSQAIIGYFVILINFGFSITTTREIATNREDKRKLSSIVSATYFIKLCLFIISFAILFLLRCYVDDIEANFQLYFYTMLWLALFEVFFPIYYFQGTEQMKYITVVTLTTRLLFFICIFIFIKQESDYILFPILNFFGSLVGILISFFLLRKDGIRLCIPQRSEIFYHIRSSYIMGLALGSNTLKSNLNIVLIKAVLSYREVAIFDLASKLINIGVTVADLINQTVFPKMAKERSKKFFRKVLKVILIFSGLFILGSVIGGPIAVKILGNNMMEEAYPILVLMSLNIPVYSLGVMLGRNCLNIYGFDKHVLMSMVYSSIAYVVLFFVMRFMNIEIGIYGFVLIYILSFFIDTSYRFIICKKKNLI